MSGQSPRTIVITGISRGCGRALAEYYLARGHRVAGCARSASAIDELGRLYQRPFVNRLHNPSICKDSLGHEDIATAGK